MPFSPTVRTIGSDVAGPTRSCNEARTEKPTTTAATPSAHAVLKGDGCPLPGVKTSANGTNQTGPSRGCASATTTSRSAK